MRRFFIGACAGLSGGYFAVRCYEALRSAADPAPPRPGTPERYGRIRRGLMVAGIARSTAALAAFAFELAPKLEGKPSRPKRVALIAAGLLADGVFSTPIDYVEGFELERQFELSDQTAAAWLEDRVKSAALSTAIVVPLVELLCALIGRAPRTWPLLATAGTVPLLILANLIAPVYIAPLFNTFEPIDGELEGRLRTLAARFGVGDAAILRVDMSRRTRKANAYVTGLFGTHRIVAGDTLIENFEPREIEFVVAHELGHFVHRDTWRFVAIGTAAAGLTSFGSRFLARASTPLTSVSGLARLAYYGTLISAALTPALAAYSRSRERAADRFAADATEDRDAGAAAFARLRDQNLSEDEQPKWMELLFSTHPSIKSRIEELSG